MGKEEHVSQFTCRCVTSSMNGEDSHANCMKTLRHRIVQSADIRMVCRRVCPVCSWRVQSNASSYQDILPRKRSPVLAGYFRVNVGDDKRVGEETITSESRAAHACKPTWQCVSYRFFFRSRFRFPFFPCSDLSSEAFARFLFLTFAFV